MDKLVAALRQWWWLAVALAAALVLGWGTYQIGHLRAQTEALSTALELQRDQAEASGQRPIAPAAHEIRRNPQIVQEPPELTDEQVQAAVNRWFETHEVNIPPEQIAAQLAAYFERHPPPRGEQGDQGEPGEDAPAVTAEQIADAAEAWLDANREQLRGEPGEDGEDGQDGEDGEDGQTPTPERLAELIRAELAKLALPLCPADWRPETMKVVTVDKLVERVLVCVPDQPPDD